MFPLPISVYIYATVAIITGGSLLYGHHEHNALVVYKQQIAVEVQKQNDKVEQEKKDAQTISSNVVSAYADAINRLHHSSTSSVLTVPQSTQGTNAAVCTTEFINAATEPEIQLEYLKQWVEEQCKLGCSK